MKLEDLKGKTVGVCVSGGLDSKTICCVLLDAGVKVKAFSANVGQPDEKDINDIKKRMAPTGVDTVIVDVTKEMADICFETVKCQAMYDGGYWNSTGIARAVTVQKLLPAMKKAGCSVLVHGATGRGNDQMRFERYTNVLDPKFGVYAPWRDSDLLKQFPRTHPDGRLPRQARHRRFRRHQEEIFDRRQPRRPQPRGGRS